MGPAMVKSYAWPLIKSCGGHKRDLSDPPPLHRCNGLRDRWVNGLASARLRPCNRYTLSPPRDLHQVQTDPSVTICPRIPTPAQRVSRICAETDDLAAEALIRQLGEMF